MVVRELVNQDLINMRCNLKRIHIVLQKIMTPPKENTISRHYKIKKMFTLVYKLAAGTTESPLLSTLLG